MHLLDKVSIIQYGNTRSTGIGTKLFSANPPSPSYSSLSDREIHAIIPDDIYIRAIRLKCGVCGGIRYWEGKKAL